MVPSTRARTSFGQWALIGVLLVVLVFAPAVVARSVTSDAEPVAFLSSPWTGWAFAGAVLRESVGAEAASPGDALSVAQRRWDGEGDRPQASRVELLYLPGRTTFHPGGEREGVDPQGSLAWLVFGRAESTEREQALGMVDFTTAEFLWDSRRTPVAAESAASTASTPAPGKDAA